MTETYILRDWLCNDGIRRDVEVYHPYGPCPFVNENEIGHGQSTEGQKVRDSGLIAMCDIETGAVIETHKIMKPDYKDFLKTSYNGGLNYNEYTYRNEHNRVMFEYNMRKRV